MATGTRKNVNDDRKCGWHDQRATYTKKYSGCDKLTARLCISCCHAGKSEHNQSCLQRLLSTTAVAQRSHCEQEAREDEDVSVNDPL